MDRLRHLQQVSRALRQAESTSQWTQMLAGAAAALSECVLFFRLEDQRLICEAARGAGVSAPEPVALAEAPAFAQAVESRECVVALHAPAQLSGPVCAAIAQPARRALLVPLQGKTRVLGVLLAEGGEELETHALELLMTLASASLELRRPASTAPLIAPAQPAREGSQS